jgi:hypothetical protein
MRKFLGYEISDALLCAGHEGFITAYVDGNGFMTTVLYHSQDNLVIDDPELFNKSKYWRRELLLALETYLQNKEEAGSCPHWE